MRPIHARRLLPTAAALALAALPLSAQRSAGEIQQDITFARGLAAAWGFTDMSESVLARLEKSNATGATADEIQLLKCDIYAISAGRIADRAQRDELLKKALMAYESYLESHSSAENRPRAESAYVDTALAYGRSLSAAAEESTGAEGEAFRKELQDVLTRAVSRTGDLAGRLSDKTERTDEEDRQLYELLMNRGALLLLIARSQTDGMFNFQQAQKTFEQVVDQAGETSSAGLRAFIGIGEVSEAQNEFKRAVDMYQFVGEVAVPRDAAEWATAVKELPPDELQRRFSLLQLATPGLLRAMMSAGDTGKACAEGMRFLNVWNREGLDLIPLYGAQSVLGVVTALTEAGGFVGGDLKGGTVEWFATSDEMATKFSQKRMQRTALDLALSLAQQINEENRGNSLAVRAQKLIADIIEQPGVEVSPQILIEAARGKFSERDFNGAIAAYKNVLTSLESQDAAVRTEFGSKVINAIGRAYQALDRQMEAAMTFQEAVTRWVGDPEMDQDSAKRFYDSANGLRRRIKGDPLIDALFVASEKAVLDYAGEGTGGEIVFRAAQKLYDEKKFSEAKARFGEVPTSTDSYEKAVVFTGVCEFQLGREKQEFGAAIAVFDNYLNKFLKDPANALGAAETRKEARRNEASATAVFYWGLAEFMLAESGKGSWQKVIDLLAGFEDRFKGQDQFAPAAMYRVIIAYHHLGNKEGVERTYKKMLELFPTSRFTANAALDVFDLLEKSAKPLRESKDPADVAKLRALLRQMAEYLEVGNANSSNPSFNNLRRESQLWMELAEWAKAEALLTKIVAKFTGTENDADLTKYVKPDLGKALFRQQKMAEAVAVLGPLVDAKQATFETTHIYSRALAGYAEVALDEQGKPKNTVRQIAGVGGKESIAKAVELLGKLLETIKSREGAYSRPWLEMKADQIYALVQAAKLETNKMPAAQGQVGTLVSEYGADFGTLQEVDLRILFRWLGEQTR